MNLACRLVPILNAYDIFPMYGRQLKLITRSKHMEIRVLQYFLAIAREQSIIRAAESLHLSQPTLSTQIKNMEEEGK